MTAFEAKVDLVIQEKDNSMIKKIILMLMLLVLALGGAGYVYLGQN